MLLRYGFIGRQPADGLAATHAEWSSGIRARVFLAPLGNPTPRGHARGGDSAVGPECPVVSRG